MAAVKSQAQGPNDLLDEEEEMKNLRWQNYQELKYSPMGLQLQNTKSFDEDYSHTRSYRFDFTFRKHIADATFKRVIESGFFWIDDNFLWKKTLIPFHGPEGPQKLIFQRDGKTVRAEDFLGAVVSHMEPQWYSDEVSLNRAAVMLNAEVQYFAALGIYAILYEVQEIPGWADGMEQILLTLTQTASGVYAKSNQFHKCTIIVNFHVTDDVRSKEYLSMFQKICRDSQERERLRAAVRLFQELPSQESINAWLKERPAYIFIDAGMFKTRQQPGGGKAPYLPDRHRSVLLKFMETQAKVVVHGVEQNLEGIPPSWYRDYLDLIWRKFLVTGAGVV